MESRRVPLVVAVVASAIAGCGNANTGGPPAPTHEVDMLFMIDNSSDAADGQTALVQNFATLEAILTALPEGPPSLHLAVVSSDMGGGSGINACVGDGHNGVFQYTAHSSPQGTTPVFTCTDTTLQNGATYIVDDNGTGNHTAPLTTVFGCIANVGITGCGLESPLGSIARALGADGRPVPTENQGFLRPNALLVIVILSVEDDCSTTAGSSSPLYDIDPNNLSAPLGPVQSFRCNEFGHLCDQGAPSRLAPNGQTTDVVTYTGCRSNENSPHLKAVAAFAQQIKSLKQHPDEQIFVASIIGVPASDPESAIPYQVRWTPAPVTDVGPWPFVSPSCGANASGSFYGDPPVRLAEFTRQFGANGILESVCSDNYGLLWGNLIDRIHPHLAR